MQKLVHATRPPPPSQSLPSLQREENPSHLHHLCARPTYHVQDQHIRNEKVRRMFYDIPCVKNMIAARQLGFLGKIIRGPNNCPACRMLTACCQHKHNQDRPYLHNREVIVRNLQLLFAKVPDVLIDEYGSLKDWFQEASHESYWKQLIHCLLNSQTPLPARPTPCPPPPKAKPPGTALSYTCNRRCNW